MATRNVSFNGNSLQSDHIFVTEIDDDSAPTRVLSMYTFGHANGSKIPYDQYTSKNITISGTIYGDTIADLDNRIDTFKGYFTGVDRNLDVDYNSGTRRYIATMQSISINRPGGLAYAGFTVSLVCSSPFGRDTTATTLFNYSSRNLTNNSSFENGSTAWFAYNTPTSFTVTTAQALYGTHSMQVVTSGSGNQGIGNGFYTVSGTYTLSCYFKGTAGTSVTVQFDVFDNTTTYTRSVGSTLVLNGTWQRASVTFTTTGSEAKVNLLMYCTAATTFYVDGVLFEQGSSPSDYSTATARSNSSYADVVTFNGTAPWQQPIMTLTLVALTGGTNQAISFGNNATGQQITVTRTWTTNDVLVIDSTTKTVTVNGVTTDYSGAFPEFQPGSQTIAYNDGFTSRTVSINCNYYAQYL